jgi:acetolactate synthase-1/2/3 large subunit
MRPPMSDGVWAIDHLVTGAPMNVADRIAEWLVEKEIYHAFGIIGGGNVALFEAIAKKNKTQIVCCHHEQAAAMASTYYNRTKLRLASVVLCTTGAGSSNALTGVLAAHMDGIPLLVISGNEAHKHMYAKTRIWGVQGNKSAEIASMMGKQSWRPNDSADVIPALHAAHQEATAPRHGAVWVDICKDICQCQL